MFSNTLRRFSKVMLVVSIAFAFVAVAHASSGRKQSRAKTPMTLQDVFHLHVDVIEVAAKTLAATTDQKPGDQKPGDQKPGSRQIIDAVRNTVEAGTGRVRYTFETPMVVGSKLKLTAGLNEPFVRNRKTTKDGLTNSQVEYENVGCSIELYTEWIGSAPEDGIHMKWNAKLSDLITKSGVRIVGDLDAPLFISQKSTFGTIVVPGDTIVFRTGVQRGQADDARISVIIATIMAAQPESSKE